MTKKNRNDYIKNPVSGRPIIVGGRTYNELVKQGYFEDIYKDENILDETENMELMKDKIDELNTSLPENIRAVRGRGRFRGKIVKKIKRPIRLPKYKKRKVSAARIQARGILEEISKLDADGDLEEQLAELITQQNQPQEDFEDTEVDYEDTEVDDYSDDEYDGY